jgi:hypothetical protein
MTRKRPPTRRPASEKIAPLDSEVAQMLAELAAEAESGTLTAAFVVTRNVNGEYGYAWMTDHSHHADELLLEVGSAKIRARIDLERDRKAASKQ